MVRIFVASLLLITLLNPAAFAAKCDDTVTQADMTQCALNDFKREDAELNRVYEELRVGYAPFPLAKAALTKAQKAWLAFRDAECALSGAGEREGSAYPMVVNQCLAQLTAQRVGEIRKRLSCEEGDLSCIALTGPD
jgi:uncharacterized protein YecT (DUF1311 family)